jgi:hypothetical protein
VMKKSRQPKRRTGKKIKRSAFIKRSRFNKFNLAIFAVVFAIVGVYFIFHSFAANFVDTLNYRSSDFFASNSVWNTPIPASAPLDKNSAVMGDYLRQNMHFNADGTPDDLNNSYRSLGWERVYTVPANTPLKSVCSYFVLNGTAWQWMTDLHEAWMTEKVPIPDGIENSNGGGDQASTIYSPSLNKYWDFFGGPTLPAANQQTDPKGRHCDYVSQGGGVIHDIGAKGGTIPDSQASPGYFRDNTPTEDRMWGRRASALPALAGGILPDEWNHPDPVNGFGHTLQMVVPWAQSGAVYWPAARTDGAMGLPAIPEGARVRIDPTAACPTPSPTEITTVRPQLFWDRSIALCHTLQKYGAIVSDQSGGGVYVVMVGGGTIALNCDGGNNSCQHWAPEYWDMLGWWKSVLHFQVLDPAGYMTTAPPPPPPNPTPPPTPIPTPPPTPLPPPSPTPPPPIVKLGDIDGNKKVDIIDLSILLSNYSKTKATAKVPACDLNNDNVINIFDLSILLSNYGT